MKSFLFALPLFAFSLHAQELYDEEQFYDDVEYESESMDSGFLAINDDLSVAKQPSRTSSLFSYREPLEPKRVNFFVSYLFWKTLEDNLEYAIKGEVVPSSQTPPNFTPSDANGDFEFNSLNWSSGVRAGLGYTFNHDLWDVFGIYTYYSTEGTDVTHRPAPPLSLQTTFRDNSGISGTKGKAFSHISLTYQEGDLLLGRRFLISDQILLKLVMGLLGTHFDQDWLIKYSGILANTNLASTNHLKNNWDFSGGGARLGINLEWYIGKGFSLIGQFSGALVLGHYDFFYKAFNKATSPNPTGVAHFKENRIIPNSQAMLGLDWGKFYTHWGFNISLGYEINSWWNLHLLPVTPYNPLFFDTERYPFHRDGNVSFHGLNAQVGFSF